jgi:hypothetical protein
MVLYVFEKQCSSNTFLKGRFKSGITGVAMTSQSVYFLKHWFVSDQYRPGTTPCAQEKSLCELEARPYMLYPTLKNKGYPLKILLKRTRGLLNKEKSLFGISAFGVFQMIL